MGSQIRRGPKHTELNAYSKHEKSLNAIILTMPTQLQMPNFCFYDQFEKVYLKTKENKTATSETRLGQFFHYKSLWSHLVVTQSNSRAEWLSWLAIGKRHYPLSDGNSSLSMLFPTSMPLCLFIELSQLTNFPAQLPWVLKDSAAASHKEKAFP